MLAGCTKVSFASDPELTHISSLCRFVSTGISGWTGCDGMGANKGIAEDEIPLLLSWKTVLGFIVRFSTMSVLL
jgi:hypothetical protein